MGDTVNKLSNDLDFDRKLQWLNLLRHRISGKFIFRILHVYMSHDLFYFLLLIFQDRVDVSGSGQGFSWRPVQPETRWTCRVPTPA